MLDTKVNERTGKEGLVLKYICMLHITCYCCGKEGHKAQDCRHKNAKYHACHKTGNLAKVCQSKTNIRQWSRRQIVADERAINEVIFESVVLVLS